MQNNDKTLPGPQLQLGSTQIRCSESWERVRRLEELFGNGQL